MCFDYSILLGKIVEVYRTQTNFALAIGMSERSLSLKMNNKVSWKDTEIAKAVELLGINEKEISKYFFNRKVQIFEHSS